MVSEAFGVRGMGEPLRHHPEHFDWKPTVRFPPQLGRSSSPETVILPVPPSIQSYLKPVPPLIGSRLHCRDLAHFTFELKRK